MNKWAVVISSVCIVLILAYVISSKNAEDTGTQTMINSKTPTNTDSKKETEIMKSKSYSKQPPMIISKDKQYTAKLNTSAGVMTVVLDQSDAPAAVNNFVFLAREGFYDNTTFHRVIKGFMIQGGDPKGDGTGGPGYRFNDEPITKDYTRGTLAMANAGANTNGSQFFIMHADNPLPKNYVIFGRIDPSDSESLKTLDAIASTTTRISPMGEQSVPVTPVEVTSIIIEEK